MGAILYLDTAEHCDGLIRWSAWMASRMGHGLEIVICEAEGDSTRRRKISLDKEEQDSELAGVVVQSVKALENQDVKLARLTAPKPGAAAVVDVIEQHPDFVFCILPLDLNEPKQVGALTRKLFRAAPSHLALIRPGRSLPKDGMSFLAPLFEGAGSNALASLFRALKDDDEASVEALFDAENLSRSRRTLEKATSRATAPQRLEYDSDASKPLIDQVEDRFRQVDAVMVESTEQLSKSKSRKRLRELIVEHADDAPTAILVRSLTAGGPGLVERLIGRLRETLPVLQRDERIDLYKAMETGGKVSADFLIMMMLSSGIAALGLLQNAGAVVIGAMVVAPLMTPLVALGLALVQANAVLFRKSLAATTLGLGLGLLTSIAIGFVTPHIDLTPEIMARTEPTVIDLAIALFSGLAGAYAIARPGIGGTLVGVAIAVALVPPLATTGICLTRAAFDEALGAFLLFLTNAVTIVLGASAVFRFFDLDGARNTKAPVWVRRTNLALMLALITLLAPLAHDLSRSLRVGPARALFYPLSPDVRDRLGERIAQEEGVDVIFMARSGVRDQEGVKIVLASEKPLETAFVEDLDRIAHETLPQEIPVRVLMLQETSVIGDRSLPEP